MQAEMRGTGHRYIGAKVLMAAAWCIIMLHSVVPHHHHDCCDGGLVFENELDCQCEHHNHDCDHHDGSCKLQDLLSQLVISTKDDKFVLSGQWSVVSGQWSALSGQWPVVGGQWSFVDYGRRLEYYDRATQLPASYAAAESLRGPPVYC
ncbi:MAG: hypothetical protein J5526_08730 [Bacteroidales bacterium]|nr:hypothetical protein [Bacteroidales bacterium]